MDYEPGINGGMNDRPIPAVAQQVGSHLHIKVDGVGDDGDIDFAWTERGDFEGLLAELGEVEGLP